MKSTKAQIKMFETLAILVVFFFLVGFGFIFYAKVKASGSVSELEEANILRAIQVAEKASFLPELQCSFDNVAVEDCIDMYKLFSASEILQENLVYYYDIFGYSVITMDVIYPENAYISSYPIYYNPKPDSGKIATQIPMSLYDPVKDTYSYGVLNVEAYS